MELWHASNTLRKGRRMNPGEVRFWDGDGMECSVQYGIHGFSDSESRLSTSIISQQNAYEVTLPILWMNQRRT